MITHGRTERDGIPLKMADNPFLRHEAIRIRPGICPTWELNRPVRRDQAKAIPPIPPRLTDSTPLNHEMLNTASSQLMADRQTSLAAPHHHHVEPLIHRHTPAYTHRADGTAPIRAALRAVTRTEISWPSLSSPYPRHFNALDIGGEMGSLNRRPGRRGTGRGFHPSFRRHLPHRDLGFRGRLDPLGARALEAGGRLTSNIRSPLVWHVGRRRSDDGRVIGIAGTRTGSSLVNRDPPAPWSELGQALQARRCGPRSPTIPPMVQGSTDELRGAEESGTQTNIDAKASGGGPKWLNGRSRLAPSI